MERILHENENGKARIAELSMKLTELIASSYAETDGNICIFDDVLDEIALRELVNLLMEKCSGIAAAFSGNDEQGYRYIIGSRNTDLRKITKTINSGIGGRGGGKSGMIQGSASENAETIRKFIENLAV